MLQKQYVEGRVSFGEYRTWYRSCGNLKGDQPPVIILHDGLRASSEYMWPLQSLLAEHSIPSLVYDQIGSGRSTHLPTKERDTSFWSIDLFLHELSNLLHELFIDQYDLWGHGYGGMLASEFAIDKTRSKGLNRLVLHSSLASRAQWDRQAQILRQTLAPAIQEALQRHDYADTTANEEYEAAIELYYSKYVCRMEPLPDCLQKALKSVKDDPTACLTMLGPDEFVCTGSLKNWSIEDRLGEINVPTLIINGEYDEANNAVTAPLFKGIAKAKWITIPDSSHESHLEQPGKVQRAAAEFLLMD